MPEYAQASVGKTDQDESVAHSTGVWPGLLYGDFGYDYRQCGLADNPSGVGREHLWLAMDHRWLYLDFRQLAPYGGLVK